MLRTGAYTWLDSLDLAIHEAGHVIFGIGGEFAGLVGGTLAQLLIPSLFIVALWKAGDRHGATVPLWWLGQNLWNISVYVRDARAQELPLLGGGEHDWFLILDRFHALHHDAALGRATHGLGVLIYAGSIALGIWFATRVNASARTETNEAAPETGAAPPPANSQ
jgi:hypothetical protein